MLTPSVIIIETYLTNFTVYLHTYINDRRHWKNNVYQHGYDMRSRSVDTFEITPFMATFVGEYHALWHLRSLSDSYRNFHPDFTVDAATNSNSNISLVEWVKVRHAIAATKKPPPKRSTIRRTLTTAAVAKVQVDFKAKYLQKPQNNIGEGIEDEDIELGVTYLTIDKFDSTIPDGLSFAENDYVHVSFYFPV